MVRILGFLKYFCQNKKTSIGNDVWIGNGAIIKAGVNISDGAVIGAHAVVTRDVPPYAVVAGIPAKLIKYRFESAIIQKLLKIKWWEFQEDKMKEIAPYFHDVNLFLSKVK